MRLLWIWSWGRDTGSHQSCSTEWTELGKGCWTLSLLQRTVLAFQFHLQQVVRLELPMAPLAALSLGCHRGAE